MQVNKWSVNPEIISTFSQLWSVLDPGTGSITTAQLLWLLQRLPQPLGAPTLQDAKAKMRNMVLIRDDRGRMAFRMTLYELMRAAIAVPLPRNVRVVQQNLSRLQQFFEKHPVDADGMACALRGTFDVDYLLVDGEDVVWSEEGEEVSSGVTAGQHEGGEAPLQASGGAASDEEARSLAAQPLGHVCDQQTRRGWWQRGGMAGPLVALLWGRPHVTGAGGSASTGQQHSTDGSSLSNRPGSSVVSTSVVDVRFQCCDMHVQVAAAERCQHGLAGIHMHVRKSCLGMALIIGIACDCAFELELHIHPGDRHILLECRREGKVCLVHRWVPGWPSAKKSGT